MGHENCVSLLTEHGHKTGVGVVASCWAWAHRQHFSWVFVLLLFCSADVTAYLTKFCSGKRQCKISNMEAFFEAYHTCPDDLKSYVLASYECVAGEWHGPGVGWGWVYRECAVRSVPQAK